MTDFQYNHQYSDKIVSLHSEFENIYRITTEHGLIIDIFVTDNDVIPAIGLELRYCINTCNNRDNNRDNNSNNGDNNSAVTVMNGIIYEIEHDSRTIYVSFGGLLAKIPSVQSVQTTQPEDRKVGDKLCFTYYVVPN